jgi:S-DNA-T family DNA segregation ATPase FtsK/SpoIIIE
VVQHRWLYNLEEFAITDEKKQYIPCIPKPSKYEVDKEALKPTISHSSEINLDPVSKRSLSKKS